MPYIPKPFKRPSVDLDEPNSRKWAYTYAGNLVEGDTVRDRGLVTATVKDVDSEIVTVQYLSGLVEIYPIDGVLYAFTEASPVGLSN